MPVIFLVIIATVTVYGLTASPLARWLGLSKGVPQGVLFLGAQSWVRQMARALHDAGIEVLLVDTNHHEIQAARLEGLPAYHGSILSEDFELTVPLEGIGHVLGMTHNDEVNALACLQLAPLVGRSNVYQIRQDDDEPGAEELPLHLRGRLLFEDECRYWNLESRFRAGAVVKRTRLGAEFDVDDFYATYEREGAPVVPLFLLRQDGRVQPYTADTQLEPQPGDTLCALVDEQVPESWKRTETSVEDVPAPRGAPKSQAPSDSPTPS